MLKKSKNIRHLRKLANESVLRDDAARRTNEDSSTASTKQGASSVKFAKRSIIGIITILLIGLIYLFGVKLDKNAELITYKMYKHDKNGVIIGAQSISYQAKKQKAIIFIHGFGSSPRVFTDLINDIKDKTNSDIYAPLLPYNARDLQTLSKTDNEVVLTYLEQIITRFAKIYKKITIVGLSYGGAQLAKLIADNKIPNNATLILYAPAFYITSNNFFQRNFAKLYSYWRNYCDYKILGCGHPNYDSADNTAKSQFAKQKDFSYVNIPSTLTMFKFDLKNRNALKKIQRPFSIIIAKDDSRVSYKDIKKACDQNRKYCKLHTFSSGKHLIHWGKNKLEFERLLLEIP